jgi:hypothetical protein
MAMRRRGAADALRSDAHPSSFPMDPRTTRNVFRREGEFWTIVYGGVTCHLRDTIGLKMLEVLLRRPGEFMTAIDLVRSVPREPTLDAPKERATDAHESFLARERARVRATRAIKSVLQRLAQRLPPLAAHFAATVRTGHRCVYFPDPRVPIVWQADGDQPADR